MKVGFEVVDKLIDSYRDQMVGTLSSMIPLRAVSPMSGGEGESKRAVFLQGMLESWGFKTERYDYVDDTGAHRPNIITRFGTAPRTIWFVGHMDTVSEGNTDLWSSDPFTAKIDGDRIYGRGAEDDGQGVVSSMYALKALKESKAPMKYSFGLALVADEELGSRFGMKKLMDEGIFKEGDMFMVPDFGFPDGSVIEVGEKGMLWLKITVTGVQVHASIPDQGKNAFRYAARLVTDIDEMLHSKYSGRNPIFRPDVSTFEMTRHDKNVDSVNIVPGTDVFYIDCRILPQYNPDEVISDIEAIARSQKYSDVKVAVETFNREDPAPATSADSEIVKLLESSLKDLRGINAVKSGIGGGTCATFPRKAGMQAAVWVTNLDLAHQPNEFCEIANLVNDTKVFAHMML